MVRYKDWVLHTKSAISVAVNFIVCRHHFAPSSLIDTDRVVPFGTASPPHRAEPNPPGIVSSPTTLIGKTSMLIV